MRFFFLSKEVILSSQFYLLFFYPNFGTVYNYLIKNCLLIVYCDFSIIEASAGFISTQSHFAFLFKTMFRIRFCWISEFFNMHLSDKKGLLIFCRDIWKIHDTAGSNSTQSSFAYLFKALFRVLVCSIYEIFSSA